MRIVSIFLTVNGECCKWGQGSWAVFIRTSGCSVQCNYCDTKYANNIDSGEEMSIEHIVDQVDVVGRGIKKVVITGGEPTEQKQLMTLVNMLLKCSYDISVETNGIGRFNMLDKEGFVHPLVSWVVDFKLPSAGVVYQKSSLDLHKSLGYSCFSKFVILNQRDFRAAEDVIRDLQPIYHSLYFSPAEDLKPKVLFDWMKGSDVCLQNNVGYSYQIHKIFFENYKEEEV